MELNDGNLAEQWVLPKSERFLQKMIRQDKVQIISCTGKFRRGHHELGSSFTHEEYQTNVIWPRTRMGFIRKRIESSNWHLHSEHEAFVVCNTFTKFGKMQIIKESVFTAWIYVQNAFIRRFRRILWNWFERQLDVKLTNNLSRMGRQYHGKIFCFICY
jgi:hypothetical protein